MSDNELIAEFMGFRYGKNADKNGYLKYNKSWDWLMPVVEKIQSIEITPPPNYQGYRIEIVVRGYVRISGFPMPTITTNVSSEGGLLPAVYKAVVEFIKWYTSNHTSL